MTVALGANQISITHRYFSGAVPGSKDYQYLTMEQAAGDYHRIVELFKEIYPVPKGIFDKTGSAVVLVMAVWQRFHIVASTRMILRPLWHIQHHS
ncbi:MAG: hypothetical protein Q7J65_01735 [Candidatus Marinimicrobia bacterium]|nr:hypothetical protein [Candidatus Neomarinimicrobiota bacterium]